METHFEAFPGFPVFADSFFSALRTSGDDARGLDRTAIEARVAAPWWSAGSRLPRQRDHLRQVQFRPWCGAVKPFTVAMVMS